MIWQQEGSKGVLELFSRLNSFVLQKRFALRVLFVIILFACACAPAVFGQVADKQNGKSTQGPGHQEDSSEQHLDPLGRSTPHGTLVGFLQAVQRENYRDAAQYLQLSKLERSTKGEKLSRQLRGLMDEAFVGRIGAVNDTQQGSPQYSVPSDRERIGEFRVNDSRVNVELVHISDANAGYIWLFSSSTLTEVPGLFDQLEEDELEAGLPKFLVQKQILNTPIWRWLALLLAIPIAMAISWTVVALLRGILRVWLRKRTHPLLQNLHDSSRSPTRLIFTVLFHWVAVQFLHFPLLFREYYQRLAGVLLTAGVSWLIFRLVGQWAERERAKALAGSRARSGSIVLLGQRLLNVVVVIVAIFIILSIVGFNMTTAVAGLGIGSIIIAFAAQKTLENLIGGISILSDEVIRVGEVCRIGEEIGVVEDISLRSTRFRTLDSSELSVPNGQLANMNIENLSRHDRTAFRTTIELQRSSSPEQLRCLLTNISTMLEQDPRVGRNILRVRLTGFGESSIDAEIHCEIMTANFNEFFAIREELLLRVIELIAESGTALALPSRTLYLNRDETTEQKSLSWKQHQRRTGT